MRLSELMERFNKLIRVVSDIEHDRLKNSLDIIDIKERLRKLEETEQ